MLDRAGHKTVANIRGRSIQRTRIRLTQQVDWPPPSHVGAQSNYSNRAWFGANRTVRDRPT
jgi:hypothetical protein